MVHRRQINKEAMQREAGMRDHTITKERKLMHKSMNMHSDFGFKLASQFLVKDQLCFLGLSSESCSGILPTESF